MDDQTEIARVLRYWLDEMPITIAQVAANGGPSRSTMDAILSGRRQQPNFATLRSLAVAVTTHPKRGTRDASATTRCLTELSLAAGYGDVLATEGQLLLEDAMMMHLHDVALMRVWVTFFTGRAGLGMAAVLRGIGGFDARVADPPDHKRSIE